MRSRHGRLLLACLAFSGAVGAASALPAAAQWWPKVCHNGTAVGTPITGGPKLGRYNGVKLPPSFKNSRDEVHVTAQIYAIFSARKDWACFAAAYPQAEKIFEGHVKEMGGGSVGG